MYLARAERLALADAFAGAAPDAPTLCAGWTAADLLAHLLVRDRRPDAAAGMAIRRLAGRLAAVTGEYRALPWDRQVRLLADGPPRWNPMGWGPLERAANGIEFFVHHEDLRRGGPRWQPRDLDRATTAQLTALVASPAVRLRLRSAGCGVVASTNGERLALRPGAPTVTLIGEPGEILLWVMGRDACAVDVTGDPDAVAALDAARHGH